MKRLTVVTLLAVCVAAVRLSPGAVTDLVHYHLGESDVPPAIPGGPGDAVTVDSVVAFNANKFGLTFYCGTTGGGVGLAPGSTESMCFQNVDSRYVTPAGPPASIAGITDNFGIEAYVESFTGTDARPFYCGGAGFPTGALTDGFGLTISGGQYVGVIGGVGSVPTGHPVAPGTPVEFALVRNAGSWTAYVNDAPSPVVALGVNPVGASDTLSMGNFLDTTGPLPPFAGAVDEARIFNFAPGTFNPSTDLGGAAVPEPFGALPVLLAALGLFTCRSRTRSAVP